MAFYQTIIKGGCEAFIVEFDKNNIYFVYAVQYFLVSYLELVDELCCSLPHTV